MYFPHLGKEKALRGLVAGLVTLKVLPAAVLARLSLTIVVTSPLMSAQLIYDSRRTM